MRYVIVILSLICISFSTSTARAHLSAGVDPATFTEEASQTTEDEIRLNRVKRRDVQKRLTGLGFDTKLTGKFDDETRAVITRWQAARGYPASGYLNKLQHKALLSEPVAATQTSSSEDSDGSSRRRRRSVGGPPNPGQFLGNVVGGVVGGVGGIFRH
jgi:peptidoglycan hydrolase-like protein with peptidoglycan-binding domain